MDDPCQDRTLTAPCSGVFWFLEELTPGDEITIDWDGQSFRYAVEVLCWIPAEEDFNQFAVDVGAPTLTMITAAGKWAGSSFSHRLVVRASTAGGASAVNCGPEVVREGFPGYEKLFTGDVHEVEVSPLILGQPGLLLAEVDPVLACRVEMRRTDGLPLFATEAYALGGGVFGLEWRVWERLEQGFYDITVNCGGAPLTKRVSVSDRPTRQF
jgi:hypothetical protein